MIKLSKFFCFIFLATLFCFASALHVSAATHKTPATADTATQPGTEKAPTTPDPHLNSVLADIIKFGAKLYYLGNTAGLDGWFIINDGQIQIAYATADGQHALVGALFGPNGENVTSNQIDDLLKSNPDVKSALVDAAATANQTPKNSALPASLPSSAAAPSSPAPSSSPGEQLYSKLVVAKGVTVGTNTTAPLLLMVIDPNCPHCQATWRRLRDFVSQNILQVRLIPIGNENSDSERVAAKLLEATNPLDTWNKYVDGDKSQFAGTPDKSSITATQSSHTLVDSWSLRAIPVLVYRSTDGQIKIEQGEPKNLAAVMKDMGVSPP